MLTIQEIKKAHAGDNPRRLYDRDGLYLVVTPTGGGKAPSGEVK